MPHEHDNSRTPFLKIVESRYFFFLKTLRLAGAHSFHSFGFSQFALVRPVVWLGKLCLIPPSLHHCAGLTLSLFPDLR